MDQLPRLGKRELICLLLFTCNYVVSVWRGFLFLWVLGMGYVILLWHSLSLPLIILIFSQDCGWQAHIAEIVKKAWQRINIIMAFKFKLDRASVERMYVSFVRPVLEYGGPIWDYCSNENKSSNPN